MNIGIDYQTASGAGGNARYSKELSRALAELNTGDDFFLYDFLHNIRKYNLLQNDTHTHKRFVYLTPPYAPDNIQDLNEIITRLLGRLDRLDIFHFTNPHNVVSGSYKMIVTIHDLSTFTHRDFAKTASHVIFEEKIPVILKESHAIIAVSEYTKRDLIERFNINEKKISVIYEAASKNFFPDQKTNISEKYGVERFILYAGQLQPRKNLINLITAFASIQVLFPDISLILVGRVRDEKYKKELRDIIVQYSLQKAIVFAENVDDSTLRKLYSNAECFVYPSLFEGFGLPVLEALQCGTPAIVSNTTSLPEIVGEAGILVDPTRSDEIAQAMKRILKDKDLYKKLQAATLLQAQKFSWKKAAQETLTVYQQSLVS